MSGTNPVAQFLGGPVLLASGYGASELSTTIGTSEQPSLRDRVKRAMGKNSKPVAGYIPPYAHDRVVVRDSYTLVDGVAIIDIRGLLASRANRYFDGYDRIRTALNDTEESSDVHARLMRYDTPGGVVDGISEAGRDIAEASARNGGKPIWAYVGSKALSGGCWLAAACDRIVGAPECLTGSVGVIMLHADQSEMLEKWGMKLTEVTFGDKKRMVPGGNLFRSAHSPISRVRSIHWASLSSHLSAIIAGLMHPQCEVRKPGYSSAKMELKQAFLMKSCSSGKRLPRSLNCQPGRNPQIRNPKRRAMQ